MESRNISDKTINDIVIPEVLQVTAEYLRPVEMLQLREVSKKFRDVIDRTDIGKYSYGCNKIREEITHLQNSKVTSFIADHPVAAFAAGFALAGLGVDDDPLTAILCGAVGASIGGISGTIMFPAACAIMGGCVYIGKSILQNGAGFISHLSRDDFKDYLAGGAFVGTFPLIFVPLPNPIILCLGSFGMISGASFGFKIGGVVDGETAMKTTIACFVTGAISAGISFFAQRHVETTQQTRDIRLDELRIQRAKFLALNSLNDAFGDPDIEDIHKFTFRK